MTAPIVRHGSRTPDPTVIDGSTLNGSHSSGDQYYNGWPNTGQLWQRIAEGKKR
jgi:hypothetical protein